MKGKLSPTMTLREFENGYWYADELKEFATRIGIPQATRLRKDEIERAIVTFLRTGVIELPTKRALRKTGVKDLERGLSLKLPIAHYTSNRETKEFITREARKADPQVREKFAALGQEIPEPAQQTPEALRAYHEAEIKLWWPLTKAAGIKIE